MPNKVISWTNSIQTKYILRKNNKGQPKKQEETGDRKKQEGTASDWQKYENTRMKWEETGRKFETTGEGN